MNEKKLTDEELAKAILQSIEYSKTITYFDEWGNCKSIMMTDVIDLINRLKEGRKTFFRIAKQRNEEKRELQKKIDEQQAEIERLTEERDMYANDLYWKAEVRKREDFITELTVESAKLQKQVDELTKPLYDEDLFNLGYAKAVKDTAKGIGIIAIQLSNMCESFYEFQNRIVDLIETNYGVEIVRETIIPTKGVEVE